MSLSRLVSPLALALFGCSTPLAQLGDVQATLQYYTSLDTGHVSAGLLTLTSAECPAIEADARLGDTSMELTERGHTEVATSSTYLGPTVGSTCFPTQYSLDIKDVQPDEAVSLSLADASADFLLGSDEAYAAGYAIEEDLDVPFHSGDRLHLTWTGAAPAAVTAITADRVGAGHNLGLTAEGEDGHDLVLAISGHEGESKPGTYQIVVSAASAPSADTCEGFASCSIATVSETVFLIVVE